MIRTFLNKPCYLIPLTKEEVKVTATNNKVVLYVDKETKKLDIAIPILEKYGFSNMENAIEAEEKWYFYPSNQDDAIKAVDDRPIFKLSCEKNNDIKVTSNSSDDFFTTIKNFNNNTTTGIKSKVKEYTPSFY